MNEDLETIIREVYSCYDVRYGNAIVDLKQRIDKAIEYLTDEDYWISQTRANYILLAILKGSDKE